MILATFSLIITALSVCNFFSNLFIFFIVAFGLIVLNLEILSLFQAFTSQNLMILALFELILSIIFNFYYRKNNIFKKNFFLELIKVKRALLKEKSLLILAIFFLFTMICFYFISINSIPLEPDSRGYHFSRIFNYIKQASFGHFETTQIRSLVMPFNSEMIYSYFYVFKKSDVGFGLISYISYIFLVLGLYNFSSILKIQTNKKIFLILIFSSLAPVLVQIPSLQTDILVGALIIASIYLFALFLKKKNLSLIYFSTLAYCLAIGTKTTAILCFPTYLIILFSYSKIYYKNEKILKNFIYYILFFALNFVVFSSYNYILNYIDYHNFLSNQPLLNEHSIDKTLLNMIYNFTYFLGDFFGFKVGILGKISVFLQDKFLNLFSISINNPSQNLYDERTTGFLLFGIFAIIPSIIYSFSKFKTKREKFLLVLAICFLANFFLIVFSFMYSKFVVRYYVTFVSLFAFCFIYLYESKILRHFLIVLACLNFFFYGLFSTRQPLYFLFNLDKNNFKKEIILNRQTDSDIAAQYRFLEEFKKKFNQNDRVVLLDDYNFYEIKQLMNFGYRIDFVDLFKFKEDKKYLKNYDYLIAIEDKLNSNYYYQKSDNFSLENLFYQNSDKLYCAYVYNSAIKNRQAIYERTCFFSRNYLKKFGLKFVQSYKFNEKTFDIWKIN